MNWIHKNLYGKICMIFGTLALIFTLSTISTNELNDGEPGLVSYLVSNIVSALTPNKEAPKEPIASSLGIFPLSEKDEKHLLVYTSVALVIFSLLLALISEKANEFNLYYAAGVLSSFSALIYLSITLTAVLLTPTLITLWLLRRANKRKG